MQEDKIEKIDESIFEAKRFILNVSKWKKRLNSSEYMYASTKEGGAAKRSSLDLTRVLAELRKA